MKTKYYIIDGINAKFDSLHDVRRHFSLYNDTDKKDMDNTYICGYNGKGEEINTRIFRYKGSKVVLSLI